MTRKSAQSDNPAKSPSSPRPRSRRTPRAARGPLDREPTEIRLLREFVTAASHLVYNVHGDRVCAHCGKQESFVGPFSKRGAVVHPHCRVTRARKFLAAWDRVKAMPLTRKLEQLSEPAVAIRKPRKHLAWDT